MMMIMQSHKKLAQAAITSAAALILAACSNSDNNGSNSEVNPQDSIFDVSVTNLTAAQPLSPLALVAHNDDYQAFMIGEPASNGLEVLAEGGDNSMLISEAVEAGAFTTVTGTGPIGPKSSSTVSITLAQDQLAAAELSLLTMLVNTNDAFTGVTEVSLSGLELGESMTMNALSYDSGTEANSEALGTIPGPADGGEGFNSVRDDLADHVTLHSGAITMDDGLNTSVLTEAHRWDNPTARVTITRVQ
jgi:hypothetical protein